MTIEELFEKYGIKSIEELDETLSKFVERVPDIFSFMIIIDAYGEYCKSIGKEEESKIFIQTVMKKIAENGGKDNGQ